EAEQRAARIESQLLAGEDTCPDLASEMTLSEALERYAKEVTPTKKGAEQELRRIRAWQKRPLASLKLSLLTAAHFSEFKKERENEGKSANTIRLDLMLISAVFKKARKAWGMPYLKNPIAGVELPGGELGPDLGQRERRKSGFSSSVIDLRRNSAGLSCPSDVCGRWRL